MPTTGKKAELLSRLNDIVAASGAAAARGGCTEPDDSASVKATFDFSSLKVSLARWCFL